MQSRARHVNVVLALCGILAGFGATFLLRAALHGADPPASAAGSPPPAAAPRPAARHRGGDPPSPNALDAQWLAYSDHSTCADWAGGDGVSAIRLNPSQVAWFFSDTYLGPAGPGVGFSHLSGFLHNSVVVQTGAGPATRLVTLTGGGACTGPGRRDGDTPGPVSVVQPPNPASGQREWDADGIRVGGTVVKFYNDYRPGPIPFVPVSTTIASFPVSGLSAAGLGPAYGGAAYPALTPVPGYTPPGGGTPIVWGSAVLQAGPGGRTVYVYGWQSPDPASPVRELYLARVDAARLADFAAWQFYDAGRWTDQQSQAQPIEPAGQDLNVPSGFSVLRAGGRYWLIEAAGTGTPDIDAYPGPAPWGPFDWAQGILLYRAPGIGLTKADDFRVMYEARAEPALSTRQTLVISYNVNSEAVTAACVSISRFSNAMTQPRFVAVPMSAFGPPGARHGHALGAVPDYPAITQQEPGLWFSAWSYPGGCPPVPAVSGATAQAEPGAATLTWLSAGLGVRYRVLERSASGSYVPVRTVARPRARITGLTAGLTYQFEIVPLNIYQDRGPATFLSVKDS